VVVGSLDTAPTAPSKRVSCACTPSPSSCIVTSKAAKSYHDSQESPSSIALDEPAAVERTEKELSSSLVKAALSNAKSTDDSLPPAMTSAES